MTVRQLWVQAEDYNAGDDRRLLHSLLPGVPPMGVRDPALDFNLTRVDTLNATVHPGAAYIDYGGSTYLLQSDADEQASFDPADAADARIDLIVGQVHDSESGGFDAPAAITVIPGQSAPAPIPPATPDRAIALWEARYDAGSTSPVFTDRRRTVIWPWHLVGSVQGFAGRNAPAGWLLCNGAAVSRSTYAALFGVIGVDWGGGDGSTTFNVPDLRSRAPVGAGQASGLSNRPFAAKGGEENHILTLAEVAAHAHTISVHVGDPGHGHAANAFSGLNTGWPAGRHSASTEGLQAGSTGSRATFVAPGGATTTRVATGVTATATAANAGSGGGHNNMPPWVAINYIIKA